jgi:hypothetical protein
MATSTFDKEIIIGEEAADRLIAILNEPAPPRPKDTNINWLRGEDLKCFIQRRSATSPEHNSKS